MPNKGLLCSPLSHKMVFPELTWRKSRYFRISCELFNVNDQMPSASFLENLCSSSGNQIASTSMFWGYKFRYDSCIPMLKNTPIFSKRYEEAICIWLGSRKMHSLSSNHFLLLVCKRNEILVRYIEGSALGWLYRLKILLAHESTRL